MVPGFPRSLWTMLSCSLTIGISGPMGAPAAWLVSGCLRPHTVLPVIWLWLFTLITPAPHCAGSPFPLPSIAHPEEHVPCYLPSPNTSQLNYPVELRAPSSRLIPTIALCGLVPSGFLGPPAKMAAGLAAESLQRCSAWVLYREGRGLTQRRSNLHVPGFGRLLLIHTKRLCGFAAACLACPGGPKAALPTGTQA